MSLEIERKFLVSNLPPDLHSTVLSTTEIHQTYLATGHEEVRIRLMKDDDGEAYTMTFKRGKGMTREEVEIGISEATYKQLLEGSNKKPLQKMRKRLKLNDRIFELDIYHYKKLAFESGELLMIIETEFKSEEEANAFTPEDWFFEEVTMLTNFKNQSLWKQVQ